MYCKLFASLYQGTLRGQAHEILVFTNLLAHADKEGNVDKHFRAIAEEVGLTVDQVKKALITLESPDPESRSSECEGARIQRVADQRRWGWQIVNYTKYRAIRNEEDRAEQNRRAQAKFRANRKADSKQSKQNQPRSAHSEAEAFSLCSLPSSPDNGLGSGDAEASGRSLLRTAPSPSAHNTTPTQSKPGDDTSALKPFIPAPNGDPIFETPPDQDWTQNEHDWRHSL